MRVADYVAKFISDMGTNHVFGVTGAGIMHLTDGIACNPDLKWIALHDERSCAMAADAYTRCGNTGVCMVSTGPAATNAITGVAGAWQDSTPMLVISGQVNRSDLSYGDLRQGGVQEFPIIPLVKHITKYAVTVMDPEMILYELSKALYLSKKGRPGPVWIEIPMDVQAALIVEDSLGEYPEFEYGSTDQRYAIDIIREKKKPVFLVGQGVRMGDAIEAMLVVAEGCDIPIVTTYLGIDCLEYEHPNNIGPVGIKGTQGGNLAMQNADLLICVGTSMHQTVTGYDFSRFAPNAEIIIVNPDISSIRTEVLKRTRCVKPDAYMFFKENIGEFTIYTDWLEQCKEWKREFPVVKSDYPTGSMYRAIDMVSNVAMEGDIIVSDAGSAFYVTSQAIKLKHGQRYITSGAMATMGFSVPAAIGAHYATGKHVWAVTGDGSIQQCLAELACIQGLPITVVVLDNGGYLSIRNSQKNYYSGRLIGTNPPCLKLPDSDQIMVIECDPNQEVLPSVQGWVNPDGTMSNAGLEKMKL